jgi:hypothetical protein
MADGRISPTYSTTATEEGDFADNYKINIQLDYVLIDDEELTQDELKQLEKLIG